MKALVIGGGGFVGTYLVNHLHDELGIDVAVTKTGKENLALPNAAIYDLDVLDKEQIRDVLEKVRPDYIFHLAAQSSVALAWKNPTLTIDVNIKGSVNVLDVVRGLDFKPRILLIGSGEEYGHIRPGECPITENNNTRPGNIYAATKACQNMIGKIYADAYGMDVMMVRAFNHIGPNQAPMFVVADFCRQVARIEKGQQEPVISVGNLSARRDFTDVRDVVRAYALLVRLGSRGETYNVGSGRAIAIEDVLREILSLSRTSIEVRLDQEKLRPVDVPIIEADITKIHECTGWMPKISLKQTISETLDYWRDNIDA
jgi:GDP-4-dehydro-6-deoxy-D-mannose reductase